MLGERFKVVREDKLEGFKAGALRIALTHTAEDAAIIGVLDADLRRAFGQLALKDPDAACLRRFPRSASIQAPLRDRRDSLPHRRASRPLDGEYRRTASSIGMVQRETRRTRSSRTALMCLIRRSALVAAGNWSSDTICEDTDLGLTILEPVYVALHQSPLWLWPAA